MTSVATLPEGLAEIPPGPVLGAVLAGVDLSQVANCDTVAVLVARCRQLAYEQARVLEAVVQVGRSDPDELDGARRLLGVGDWASGEIAAALTLTGVAADRELSFAEMVVTRLPLVHAALSGGSIDRAKAWVFADHLRELPDEQIAVICAALVPLAAALTTGQLRARLARMLHDIDPGYARRRYRRAVRDRAVVGYLAPDGTVTITASGLPTDEAAVACARLDALAHAVQRAGHPAGLDQIQTDLFLGMLEGRFHHHTEQQIITALLQQHRPEDPDEEPTVASQANSDGANSDGANSDGADSDGVVGVEPVADRAAAARAGVRDVEVHDRAGADRESTTGPVSDPGNGGAAPPRNQPRVGVEIRAGLRTLLGLDDQCGEIPGLGPVLPGVARALVSAQHHGAQWRFAITDTDGLLVLAGTTRRRPLRPVNERGVSRAGVVEVHISAADLAQLGGEPAAGGPWAGVIADLVAQYADRGRLLRLLDRTPGNRFARDVLARHVETRDRTCAFPGCRRPARRCEKDHTVDHADGGPTTSDNIGPLCERHHRYKTEGWWTLVQPRPGRYRWTSPLARIYRTRGEPIRPPTIRPHPRPRTAPDDAARRPDPGPILRRPTRPARPRTRPRPTHADDPPPF